MAEQRNILSLGGSSPLPSIPEKTSRTDGWKNALSGMGTKGDKRRYTNYDFTTNLSKELLGAMYMGDGLAASIVDIFADDMTREWGTVVNDPKNKDGQGEIETALSILDAPSAFNTAEKWARLFGGALIVIGVMDGNDPATPVNYKKIKSVEYLKVFDLGDIQTHDCVYNLDPYSPNYGKIDIYSVKIHVATEWRVAKIHASRCIPFFGKKVPPSTAKYALSNEARYWGISCIQPIWDYLRDYANAFGAVSNILMELIIGKFKFSDLDEMLAAGGEKKLQTRIEAIDMAKSTIHSVLLGTDEDYIRDTATLTGIADILDRFMMNISAVTGYPVTRLFGRSPAGMNATGENDLKNYYDAVKSHQKAEIPYVQQLVNMVAEWKNVKAYTPFQWDPLFQLNEEQQAEVERKKAEETRTLADADQRYVDSGVLLPEDIYKIRFEKLLGPRKFEDVDPLPPLEAAPPVEGGIPAKKKGVPAPVKKQIPTKPGKKPIVK
jgi:phage-related protein (TIGR01555 family)